MQATTTLSQTRGRKPRRYGNKYALCSLTLSEPKSQSTGNKKETLAHRRSVPGRGVPVPRRASGWTCAPAGAASARRARAAPPAQAARLHAARARRPPRHLLQHLLGTRARYLTTSIHSFLSPAPLLFIVLSASVTCRSSPS